MTDEPVNKPMDRDDLLTPEGSDSYRNSTRFTENSSEDSSW
jgi:hypothetical protein